MVAGRAAKVSLFATMPMTCDGTSIPPELATIRVTDARTQPVEATSVLADKGRVEVRFTPQSPGVHRVVALFEPRGGRDQVDAPVARDRTKEPSWELDQSCTTLVSLSPESLVCNGQLVRAGVPVGAPLDDVLTGRLAARDGFLWSLDPDRLRVWRDEGAGALVSVVDQPFAAALADESELRCLAAEGPRAFALTASSAGRDVRLHFFDLDPVSRLISAREDLVPFGITDPLCTLVGNDAILVIAGTDVLSGDSRFVQWPFEAGERLPIESVLPGRVLELEGRRFLSAIAQFGRRPELQLSAQSLDAEGKPRTTGHLILPPMHPILSSVGLPPLSTYPFEPGTTPPWVITWEERHVELEHFLDDPGAMSGATRFHVWTRLANGTRIWKR